MRELSIKFIPITSNECMWFTVCIIQWIDTLAQEYSHDVLSVGEITHKHIIRYDMEKMLYMAVLSML